ncbi:hypothetical protein Halru_2036 [Halovivax ruber XH-70]|uniref:Uncharacterized protein n=1 Tax=Halovivax ruber (strain DSM 18193 / JCM 13892 / XH-70) TaxID=797302 RepID=L0IAK7_HALRX|nr:hypothetical protein [Halovivax ruber]AGB16630.1 hypothetical protein Halru_2036 [Halovivax ruber XH-70]
MSVQPVEPGQCDTPRCDGTAEEITPEGYVCASCAREIEHAYREAKRRDRAGQEVRQ